MSSEGPMVRRSKCPGKLKIISRTLFMFWVHPMLYSSVVCFNRLLMSQSSRRQHIEIPIRNVFDLVTLAVDQ